jgi:rhodanese-related sulfurtransferase
MSKNFKNITFFIILPMLMLLTGISMSTAADVPTIIKEELKPQLGSSDVMILDVRKGKDWKSSEFKIKGAVRASPSEFDKWATTYPKDKTLILYCA